MDDVTITIANRVQLVCPYDPDFPAKAAALGGYFRGGTWFFDLRDEQRVRDLVKAVYGTDGSDVDQPTVTVRVDAYALIGTRSCAELRLAGRSLVSRRARDSRVQLGTGVIVAEGSFPSSGGSVKSPSLFPKAGTVLEVRDLSPGVARKMIGQGGKAVVRLDATGSTVSDEATVAVDLAVGELGRLDVEMSLSYQTLVGQLDRDGLWDDRRARMVAAAVTAAIAAYHATPTD